MMVTDNIFIMINNNSVYIELFIERRNLLKSYLCLKVVDLNLVAYNIFVLFFQIYFEDERYDFQGK